MANDKFQDLAVLDANIPPNMMMTYQGKPYILKAGLEWKAVQVFGVGKYSIDIEFIERSPDKIIAKATLKTRYGTYFVNYGECNKQNTPPAMAKYALHLAITRAECRVLRMATACGYVAMEEMETTGGAKEIPTSDTDGEPATAAQIATIQAMNGEIPEGMTQADAKTAIAGLVK